jgi:pimeloyl-ACP methyl ester carboxylesterase
MSWLFGESFLQNKENVASFKELMLDYPYPQSLADQIRQFRVLELFDGCAQLQRIVAPTLVAYGQEDISSLPEESQYIANQIPNAQLIKFACGHMIHVEQSQQLAQVLREFFNLS